MNKNLLSILVIDDSEVDRISLKRAVRSSGFEATVTLVENQAQALQALRQQEFDCIFLDQNLPDCRGNDFLKNHKLEIGRASVIMVTSHGDEMIAVEAMRNGACDYMPKNLVTPEGVAQSIRYALRLNAAEQSTNKAERALIDSVKTLESVIARSPIILFEINNEGRFTMFKGKSIELLNLRSDDVVGKTVHQVQRILPFDFSKLKPIINGEESTTCVEVNGVHLEISCTIKTNGYGEPCGLMGIATDVTDLKKHELELRNDLTIARESQQVKEQFLANMSHEIRTPIHGIMSLTNLLLKSPINSDQLTYLNAVKRSADNLLVIINDILDLSKIEAQKMTFESTIFSVSELVNTTYELFRAKAEEKSITLSRQIDECIPEYVKGDPTRLSQIINNLVNNAIKFTGKGSVEIVVDLEDSNEKCSMIRFRVKDSGIGIAQDKLSTIFDMFTQAGDDINRKFGGTGLGLSIAKKLVDLQGGLIKVDSILDKGTVFTFSLPFDHPDPHELELHHTASDEPESRIDTSLRVLVVEDNDINRLVINKIMKDWGIQPDNAIHGKDALEKIKAGTYDVVLMDIEMPEMNGYQCIREIRTTLAEPQRSIKVMAMTAHANKKERDKCIGLGMDDYISKPFDPLDLKQKIVALSRKHVDLPDDSSNENTEKEVDAISTAESVVSGTVFPEPEVKLTNLEYLRMLSEDNESFFKDFINLFLTNTPETMNALVNALNASNWEGVRQAAHKVKPSLNYLGLKDAQVMAATIEEYAKESKNLEQISIMIHELCNILETAYRELETELKSEPDTK